MTTPDSASIWASHWPALRGQPRGVGPNHPGGIFIPAVPYGTTVSGNKGGLRLLPQAAPAEGRPKDAMCRDPLRLRHG